MFQVEILQGDTTVAVETVTTQTMTEVLKSVTYAEGIIMEGARLVECVVMTIGVLIVSNLAMQS